MKTDIRFYRDALASHLGDNEIEDPYHVLEIIDEFLNTHLVCTQCHKVFQDEVFYKAKIYKNRRGRMPACRSCFSEVYVKKSG